MKNSLFDLILEDFSSLMNLLTDNNSSTSRKRKLGAEESVACMPFTKRHEGLLISVLNGILLFFNYLALRTNVLAFLYIVLEMVVHELDTSRQTHILKSLFQILFSFGIADKVRLEAKLLKFQWSVLQNGSGMALACLPITVKCFAKGLHHPHNQVSSFCLVYFLIYRHF